MAGDVTGEITRTDIAAIVKQSVPFYDYTNTSLAFFTTGSTIKE